MHYICIVFFIIYVLFFSLLLFLSLTITCERNIIWEGEEYIYIFFKRVYSQTYSCDSKSLLNRRCKWYNLKWLQWQWETNEFEDFIGNRNNIVGAWWWWSCKYGIHVYGDHTLHYNLEWSLEVLSGINDFLGPRTNLGHRQKLRKITTSQQITCNNYQIMRIKKLK